ncbi:hypothetical protein ACFQY4_36955 [Catellatospora bangladeshensis]|uniref:Uncharacterized protein n=1 Tax=Catellatospora bangladeshensis TaxID=310355 RepID=A0A8J3NKV7_9ACTN|nr:hypothetical protein [Catellatospora bangladeshensis]GIF83413.1 hypothetical protein Cba03nite_47620 [Catellatospora bangladeshensis]
MYWLWCVRLSLVILAWDVGLLIHGLTPASRPLPPQLTTVTAFSVIGAVGMYAAIVGYYKVRVLWRVRPRWWPWSPVGIVLLSLVTMVIAGSGHPDLNDTAGEPGAAMLSIIGFGLSLPVYLACSRVDRGIRPPARVARTKKVH